MNTNYHRHLLTPTFFLSFLLLAPHLVEAQQSNCTSCITSNNKVCPVGDTSWCCVNRECNIDQFVSYCSDRAQTNSMKYLFCTYDASFCSATTPYLDPVYQAQQQIWTPVGTFGQDNYCYYIIRPPNEFTSNAIVKIKIESLQSTACYLNYGGSVIKADKEQPCYEGNEYSYDYTAEGGVSYIYLVAIGTAGQANLRFSYWAEYKITNGAYLGIILSCLVFFTLIAILVFVLILR